MIWLITEIVSGLTGGGGGGGAQKRMIVDRDTLNKSIMRSQMTLKQFDRQRQQNILKIVKTDMGNLSGKLAMSTPPMNGGSIDKAQKDMQSDINFIFRPLESIPFGELVLAKQWPAVTAYNFEFKSKRLNKAYQDGDWETIYKAFAKNGMGKFQPYRGDDINLTSNPNKVQHKSARDKNGYLNGTVFRVTGSKDMAIQKINKYAQAAMAAIGMMAGGWVRCYHILKGTGMGNIPKELAKNGSGSTKITSVPKMTSVEIRNDYGNYGGFFDQRSTYFAFLLNESAQSVKKRYIDDCDALMRKLDML